VTPLSASVSRSPAPAAAWGGVKRSDPHPEGKAIVGSRAGDRALCGGAEAEEPQVAALALRQLLRLCCGNIARTVPAAVREAAGMGSTISTV